MSQANKKGYHKGCFGSPTRAKRQEAQEYVRGLYRRSRRYARTYLRGRMKTSAKFKAAMRDPREREKELERVGRRRMKAIRGKDAEKRTARTQKI